MIPRPTWGRLHIHYFSLSASQLWLTERAHPQDQAPSPALVFREISAALHITLYSRFSLPGMCVYIVYSRSCDSRHSLEGGLGGRRGRGSYHFAQYRSSGSLPHMPVYRVHMLVYAEAISQRGRTE